MHSLFVAWQDETTRTWHTVGKLTRRPDGYEFVFTKGADRLDSIPETLFKMRTHERYHFPELIPPLHKQIATSDPHRLQANC